MDVNDMEHASAFCVCVCVCVIVGEILSILTLDYCWQLKSKEEQEAEVVAQIRNALALGMSVLDTMFDTVEVPVSDSEDEER
jgi:hypothetical protein